jgi:hypothetical protein
VQVGGRLEAEVEVTAGAAPKTVNEGAPKGAPSNLLPAGQQHGEQRALGVEPVLGLVQHD